MSKVKLSTRTLVVGADGLIGGALMRSAGQAALGTSRQRAAAGVGRCHLDLAEDPGNWPCPGRVDAAVICAGVSRMADCRREPAATSRVNVEGVCALAENLAARGVFVVFLSSNQVFDGSRPYCRGDDHLSPRSEYGRQKAAAEKRLVALGSSVSIVRLTKVLEPEAPLLRGWAESLRRNVDVRPFFDMYMAPVPLSLVVSALKRVVARRVSGVVQVSGKKDVSYEEAARHIARRLSASQDLIRPIKSQQTGVAEGALPHTTLDTSRMQKALGLNPPDAWKTIDMALNLEPIQAD